MRDHGVENVMTLLQQVAMICQQKAPQNVAAEHWVDTHLIQHALMCNKSRMKQRVG